MMTTSDDEQADGRRPRRRDHARRSSTRVAVPGRPATDVRGGAEIPVLVCWGYVVDTVDSSSARTERIAVAEVQRTVVAELGWLFREQPKDDYGIDAQVELVDRGS